MYVGRFLVVGPDGGAYRVSSRSFPNRRIIAREADDDGETLTVGPTDGASETDNPYVSYNCLRAVETPRGNVVAFGNGSHVDPIAEKLAVGYPARDALATALLALDFEKDDYDTPRIAATIGGDGEAFVGTVRRDALVVEAVDEPTLVATYERDSPEPFEFTASDAETAAREAYDLEFEHAVCAAGVARIDHGEGDGIHDTFETAVVNGD